MMNANTANNQLTHQQQFEQMMATMSLLRDRSSTNHTAAVITVPFNDEIDDDDDNIGEHGFSDEEPTSPKQRGKGKNGRQSPTSMLQSPPKAVIRPTIPSNKKKDSQDDDLELILPEITVKSYAVPIPYNYATSPNRKKEKLLQELEKKSASYQQHNNNNTNGSPSPVTDGPTTAVLNLSSMSGVVPPSELESTNGKATKEIIIDDESIPPGTPMQSVDVVPERLIGMRQNHEESNTKDMGNNNSDNNDDDLAYIPPSMTSSSSFVRDPRRYVHKSKSNNADDENNTDDDASLSSFKKKGGSSNSTKKGGSTTSKKASTTSTLVKDPVLKILTNNDSVKKLSGAPVKPNKIDYDKASERNTNKGPLIMLPPPSASRSPVAAGTKSPQGNGAKVITTHLVPEYHDWAVSIPTAKKIIVDPSIALPVTSCFVTKLVLREMFQEDRRGVFGGDVGSVFGDRYEITSVLGHGVFGTVYRCVDQQQTQAVPSISSPNAVAVKITHKHPLFQQQADREIEILQLLSVATCRLLSADASAPSTAAATCLNVEGEGDIDTHVIRPLFFWHFPEGFRGIGFPCYEKNLFEYIRDHDFLPLDLLMVAQITKQLVQALVHVHNRGVIHCDLKPENVLIHFPHVDRKVPHIILIDFGSAVIMDSHISHNTSKKAHKVKNNHIEIQSQFYRAPEVIVGLDYGKSTFDSMLILISPY